MKAFIYSLHYYEGSEIQTFISKFNSFRSARKCLKRLRASFEEEGITAIPKSNYSFYVPSTDTTFIITKKMI